MTFDPQFIHHPDNVALPGHQHPGGFPGPTCGCVPQPHTRQALGKTAHGDGRGALVQVSFFPNCLAPLLLFAPESSPKLGKAPLETSISIPRPRLPSGPPAHCLLGTWGQVPGMFPEPSSKEALRPGQPGRMCPSNLPQAWACLSWGLQRSLPGGLGTVSCTREGTCPSSQGLLASWALISALTSEDASVGVKAHVDGPTWRSLTRPRLRRSFSQACRFHRLWPQDVLTFWGVHCPTLRRKAYRDNQGVDTPGTQVSARHAVPVSHSHGHPLHRNND
ncbi:uncharacterized protein [Symphalangus syndactylus]|uniref:uncharacterized protein isoform X1 n=1 Tax=Symphalangus syndactylus TaxID=9590 RepID=UPI0030040652